MEREGGRELIVDSEEREARKNIKGFVQTVYACFMCVCVRKRVCLLPHYLQTFFHKSVYVRLSVGVCVCLGVCVCVCLCVCVHVCV